MVGDIRHRVPGNMRLPIQLLGPFTPHDVARISIPAVLMFSLVYPPHSGLDLLLILVGLGIGTVLALLTRHGRPLDSHLLTVGRWFTEARFVRDGSLRTRQQQYFLTEDGAAIGVIQVHPTNLAMKTQAEQHALHTIYQELIETVTYPVAIHSRQREIDLDTYIQYLQDAEQSEAERQHRLRNAYVSYCEYLNRGELVHTDHYIIVRVDPSSTEQLAATLYDSPVNGLRDRFMQWWNGADNASDADSSAPGDQTVRVELERRCTEVLQAVSRGDLAADRVTGPPLVDLAQQFHGGVPILNPRWVATPDDNGNGEWRKQVYVTECPSRVSLAWPVDLLQVAGLVDVTQVIHPKQSTGVVNQLSRTVEKLEAEIGSQQADGYRGTNRYEARLGDAEWMLDLLAERGASAVEYGCYITAHHPQKERCEETLDYVETRLQTKQFAFADPVYRTDQAYKTQSPLHTDALQETMLMPSSSAAAGFPFATTDAIGSSGIVYGEDAAEGTPVLLDRFRWSSHSMARMGMVGSGKSYAAKLELIRAWLAYDDLQLIVVDPKQEYADLVRTFGGTVYTLGEEEYRFDADVLGFQVPNRGQDDNVPLLVDVVQDLYSETAQTAQKTLIVIDETRVLMNDSTGRSVLNQFVLEARDTNTAITLISQNASHFTYCREGREILDNMPGKIFMRHDRVPASVVDYFQLSTRERQELFELNTGTDSICSEALLKVTEQGVDSKVTVRATAPEHAVIDGGGN